MQSDYKDAEDMIKEVIAILKALINIEDGEDISFYNPTALDYVIQRLIDAKCSMCVGRVKDKL